jgi:predicted ABC-type transport system involved in lysophospholipase L1 biosynthesis ATPase subunit
MLELAESHATAFIIVTHDERLAARAGRILELTDRHLRSFASA